MLTVELQLERMVRRMAQRHTFRIQRLELRVRPREAGRAQPWAATTVRSGRHQRMDWITCSRSAGPRLKIGILQLVQLTRPLRRQTDTRAAGVQYFEHRAATQFLLDIEVPLLHVAGAEVALIGGGVLPDKCVQSSAAPRRIE